MEQNVRCYKELSKPVLSGLVVLSTSAGFLMSGSPAALMPLVAVSAGTTLQAWSANAFNQVWEVENDALMKRTKRRPLPSGRMTRVHAAAFASASGLAGTGILLLGTNPLTAALGALNIGMYTLMYTPMKTRSVANTWVGSLVGALPPIMGWTAATGTLIAPEPALLGLTLFYWQFPHFFSLAWRSRADYAAGGYKMLPVVDKEGGMRTARAVLRHSLYLCPLPVLASLGGITSSMYAIESIAFNSYLVFLATRFYRKRSNKNAQKVFLASLWYLPLSLALMVYHSSNWKHSEDAPDAERTSIDQFVERAKTRLINLCPHELFTRSDINMDTGDIGTSILTRLIVSLGVWPGDRHDLVLHKRNPLKFWERHDVNRANQMLMRERPRQARANNGDREIPYWINWGYDPSSRIDSTDLSVFDRMSSQIVDELDVAVANTKRKGAAAWVTKDPRLCLTVSRWMTTVRRKSTVTNTGDPAICILIYRHPALLAESMARFSPSVGAMSSNEWGIAWEAYGISALRGCRGLRKIFVSHEELMISPWDTIVGVANRLRLYGIRGIEMPSRESVRSLFPGVVPTSAELSERESVVAWITPQLSNRARELWKFFEDSNNRQRIEVNSRKTLLLETSSSGPSSSHITTGDLWPTLQSHREDVYVLVLVSATLDAANACLALVSTIVMSDATRPRMLVTTMAVKRALTSSKRFRKLSA
eukprot:g3440.t1